MTFGRGPVVCGVDFSEPSRRALLHAHALAAGLGQPLVVLSAIDPLMAEAASTRGGPAQFAERVRRDLDAFVQDTVGAQQPGAPAISLLAPTGSAAKELLTASTSTGASVTVIGTEGLGGVRRFVFGSTTLRVMRGTDRPVLAVPTARSGDAPAGVALARILCGVDFSEASRSAARAAVALGRQINLPVTLLHAAGTFTVPPSWDVMVAPTAAERKTEAEEGLRKLAGELGAPQVSMRVESGDADEVIAREAGTTAGTLIVLGLGDLGGHRPGSTAMRILAETRVPVLAVPV